MISFRSFTTAVCSKRTPCQCASTFSVTFGSVCGSVMIRANPGAKVNVCTGMHFGVVFYREKGAQRRESERKVYLFW